MTMHDNTREWFSVDDILPEHGEDVLFYTTLPTYEVGHYDGVEWRGDVWYMSDEVTHWMPLPKPPKGESNG